MKGTEDSLSPASEMERDEPAKTAGRGTIFITASKLYFILSGYCIYLLLSRILTTEQFGVYGVVTGIVSIVNAVIVVGTQQAVSKYISEDTRRAESVKRQALRLQLLVGGTITLCYLMVAPWIAELENDASLTPYLRLSGLITISYCFYAVFVGYLNGQRKFWRQSLLDAAYSTLKLSFIVALAYIFKSVTGAVLGFGLAAVTVLAIAPLVAGRAEGEVKGPSNREFLRFQFTLLGFVLINNSLQKADLLLIKALGSSSPSEASQMAGYYTALIAVANVTYQAVISVTFVIFPLVSKAVFENRGEEVRVYISQALRYTLMMMALSATIFSSNSASLLGLLFKKNYTAGAPALSIVAYGMLFYGLLYILSTIISGSGRPRVSLLVGFTTMLISLSAGSLLIPERGLVGAACSTTIAMICGSILAGGYVYKTFGALIPLRSLASILVASLAAYAIAQIFPQERMYTLAVTIVAQTVVYLGSLLALREIGQSEIAAIQKIVSIR